MGDYMQQIRNLISQVHPEFLLHVGKIYRCHIWSLIPGYALLHSLRIVIISKKVSNNAQSDSHAGAGTMKDENDHFHIKTIFKRFAPLVLDGE
jgi:hypothetical protein